MRTPTHPDGCFVSNVRTRPYTVTYQPDCPHAKVRYAEITLRASSPADAIAYARRNIRIANSTPVTVTASGPWHGLECPHCAHVSEDQPEAERHLSIAHGQDPLWLWQ